ncbi:UNVERIFIED_CONTAM: Arginyl-tRNA--protein transferase 1 [Siphonaria sp. JEL0065]|nr:Arginyl-tRNA--protein transferase 1 [Siphonaria sp. JEL0065]
MNSGSIVALAVDAGGHTCGYCGSDGDTSINVGGLWAYHLHPQINEKVTYQSLLIETISAQSNKKAMKKVKKLLSQPQVESQPQEMDSDWVDDEEGGGPAIRDAGLSGFDQHQRPNLVEKYASAMSLDTLPEINSASQDTKMIPAESSDSNIDKKAKKEKVAWVKQPKQPKNAPKDDVLSLILEVEGTKTVNGNKWEVKLVPATFEQDTFDLYTKYQINVHKDPPTKIKKSRFIGFLVDSPLTFITPSEIGLTTNFSSEKSLGEFPGYGSFHQKYYLNGQLVAVSVLDILPACVSAVYFMYDPANPVVRNLSMGVYSGLRETAMAKQYSRFLPGLKYLYMGFYIHSCSKMRYKAQFKPSDLICPKTRVWVPVEKCIKLLDVHKVALLSTALRLEDNAIPDANNANVFGPSAITHEYSVDIKDLANIMIYQERGVTFLKMLPPNRKVLGEIGQFVKLVGINVAKQLIFVI